VKAAPTIGKPKQVFESPLLTPSGELSKSDEEYLHVLKNHLERLFRKQNHPEDVLRDLTTRATNQELDRTPTPTEIWKASRALRHAAGGCDGLRPEHLKSICRDNDLFHSYVVKYVTEFWETCRVPATWEICETTSIFKKGNATDPGNYRFIMKLVVGEKLILAIIGNRLHELIESFGTEYESQCGFRGKVGCIDALFALRVSLRKRKEHGLATWVAFIDLVKAFDTISRDILWEILNKLGCPTRFTHRIKQLHETVIIQLRKGDKAVRALSHAGVRQGDIIGPPLFNLYMFAVLLTFEKRKDSTSADCTFITKTSGTLQTRAVPITSTGEQFKVNEILYADDTAIIRNDRDSLTRDLKLIRTILREFCMEMHEGTPGKPSKTECVYFAKQPSRYADIKTFDDVDLSPIILDDTTGASVPFVKQFTYLGAQVDEHLDDKVEVDTRAQKASCAFGRFR
jgi:hypothetical protein